MTRLNGCLLSVYLCLVSSSLYAEELDVLNQDEEDYYGFFLSPSFVYSNLDISRNFADEKVDTNALGIGLSLGYEFDNHIIVQLEGVLAANFSLGGASDRYSISHKAVLLGYRFGWESVSLIPYFGKAYWDLTSKEGQLFNPGSEEVEELNGSSPIWGLGLLGHVNESSDLNISYKKINADFGDYAVISMGVSYKF